MLNTPVVNEGNLFERVTQFPPVVFGLALSLTPNQTQFVYRADQNINEQYELFAVGFPPLPAAAEVPTLSLWSLLVLVLIISVFGYYLMTRNKSHHALFNFGIYWRID